jgi:hypothetical protein
VNKLASIITPQNALLILLNSTSNGK